MTRCIGEPVSWLRLERYALGELPVGESAVVEEHLRACEACGACHRQIVEDTGAEVLQLPAAPVVSLRKPRRSWVSSRWAWAASAGLAAAAGVILMFKGPGLEPPHSRISVKGGELSMELVRLGADGRLLEPHSYSPEDRFKVVVSCPPPWSGFVEVVVYQDGQAFFPLDAQSIECGNQRSLEGAFRLDGDAEVVVCVAMTESAIEREELARGIEALPERSVCVRSTPQR